MKGVITFYDKRSKKGHFMRNQGVITLADEFLRPLKGKENKIHFHRKNVVKWPENRKFLPGDIVEFSFGERTINTPNGEALKLTATNISLYMTREDEVASRDKRIKISLE